MPNPNDVIDCGDQNYGELKKVQLDLLAEYAARLSNARFAELRSWCVISNRCGSPHTFHFVPRTNKEFDDHLLQKWGK